MIMPCLKLLRGLCSAVVIPFGNLELFKHIALPTFNSLFIGYYAFQKNFTYCNMDIISPKFTYGGYLSNLQYFEIKHLLPCGAHVYLPYAEYLKHNLILAMLVSGGKLPNSIY